MSEDMKSIIMEHWNLEAFTTMEMTGKIQCEMCHRYMSVGHISCHCGRILAGASEDAEKQITKNVNQELRSLDDVSLQNLEGIDK